MRLCRVLAVPVVWAMAVGAAGCAGTSLLLDQELAKADAFRERGDFEGAYRVFEGLYRVSSISERGRLMEVVGRDPALLEAGAGAVAEAIASLAAAASPEGLESALRDVKFRAGIFSYYASPAPEVHDRGRARIVSAYRRLLRSLAADQGCPDILLGLVPPEAVEAEDAAVEVILAGQMVCALDGARDQKNLEGNLRVAHRQGREAGRRVALAHGQGLARSDHPVLLALAMEHAPEAFRKELERKRIRVLLRDATGQDPDFIEFLQERFRENPIVLLETAGHVGGKSRREFTVERIFFEIEEDERRLEQVSVPYAQFDPLFATVHFRHGGTVLYTLVRAGLRMNYAYRFTLFENDRRSDERVVEGSREGPYEYGENLLYVDASGMKTVPPRYPNAAVGLLFRNAEARPDAFLRRPLFEDLFTRLQEMEFVRRVVEGGDLYEKASLIRARFFGAGEDGARPGEGIE